MVEYAQIIDRLNDRRGVFGIVVCRSIQDYDDMLGHCIDRLEHNKFIIVLCDEDIKKLIKLMLQKDENGINLLFENKLKELILRNRIRR